MYKKYSGKKNIFRGFFSEHHHILKQSYDITMSLECMVKFCTGQMCIYVDNA